MQHPVERPLHIEIVTPVFNRREITLQCLRSLARIDRTGLQLHVIIVDDGSSDGTSEALRTQFPEVEIIPGDGELHYTRGTNVGVAAALAKNPDYILTINNDSIFHDQFLQRLVACARAHPRSVVGPVLLWWDRPHLVTQIGAHWNTWYGGWRTPQGLTKWQLPPEPFDVEVIVGNCILAPVEAVREVGLMLEDAFPYGYGDAEWTPRMKRAGWRLLIDPEALVWFEPNATLASPRKQGWGKALHSLLFDPRNHFGIRHQFLSRWLSAPSRPSAVLGFGIHLVRVGLRIAGIDRYWPNWQDSTYPLQTPRRPDHPI